MTRGALPTGTVTFLFTDIEGSTRLLTALGKQYGAVLAAHSEILRRALALHGGIEVSTEGDAFFAVFPSAVEAVRAAATAQRELAAKPWPRAASLRVRMGMHTGEGRVGGDNYIGLDVHRAARIAAAGHGGQVLLSDATRGVVSHDLPDGVRLRDLFEHRLKDLPKPERIWQLEVDGLPSEFPPLRSLDARPNNLPASTTSLIGRQRELGDIASLLRQHRLVTLVGPGGTGKTRLALAVAHQMLLDHEDGAFFAALEDARDLPTVAATVAAVLGVREKIDRDLTDGVKAFTAERDLLVVLDNFEQVMPAAPLVGDLLAGSPKLRVLVTSRAPLHLSGEREYLVPPLGLPDLEHLPPLTSLSQYEAVALFIDRATAVKADFAVTNANAPSVAEICSRLDGLPLAIELAAARVKLLTPEAILERLVHSLPVLATGARDLPPRQRTLESTLNWSYEQLDDAESRLFRRLAVFAGGWTLEACEDVCNPDQELRRDTLEALASLADKSLIRSVDTEDGEARFGMLQVIREFAADRLEADEDAEVIRRRHAEVMLELAERAEPELVRTELRDWQRRVRRDEDNVRAALQWAIATDEAEIGLRTAAAVWRFWQYWAEYREGRRWLETLLFLPSASALTVARAKALAALGSILYWQGDAAGATDVYQQSLRIYQEAGDERRIADAHFNVAWAAVARGDIGATIASAQQALAHYRQAHDESGGARVAAFLDAGSFLMGGGGSKDDALDALRRAVDLSRQQGRLWDEADNLGSIAFVLFRAGEFGDSLVAYRDVLRAWREMENVGMLPYLKMGAALELNLDRPQRAVRLAAAAAKAVEEMGGELPAAMVGDIDPLEQARDRLAADEYAQAVDEGRAMSFDEATAYALEDVT